MENLRRFGHAYGMAFQIVDDLQDALGGEQEAGKPIRRDLQGMTHIHAEGYEAAFHRFERHIDTAHRIATGSSWPPVMTLFIEPLVATYQQLKRRAADRPKARASGRRKKKHA